eukprot:COSAG06_NODE_12362_length_1391_cov_0.806502_1_plen_49_part_10
MPTRFGRCEYGNAFLRHFILKTEYLPRQARAKHREDSTKEDVFLAGDAV